MIPLLFPQNHLLQTICTIVLFLLFHVSCFSQIPGNGIVDIDGNSYETVIIGNQEWMSENLKTSVSFPKN